MRLHLLRPCATVLVLLLALSRARGQEPLPAPAAAAAAAADAAAPTPGRNDQAGDDAGAAAILSAMASRAQQNSLSQTLIALMALAAAEVQEPLPPQGEAGGGGNGTVFSPSSSAPEPLLQAAAVGAAPTSDNVTATTISSSSSNVTAEQDSLLFRNALRGHLEELVGRQQAQFVNALSFGDDDGNDENGFKNNIAGAGAAANKKERKDALASLLAKVAERVVAGGPASIKLYDKLLLGFGSAARAASTSQPGAGPCGRYGWDAGGEYTPAAWQGPTLSLSLSLGSCALVPSLEGPGAALTAGSAWTNAVGEMACLGPGLAYALSPLTYTSAGLTGESLTVPACRLAASFGPSVSLTLTRSPKQGGNGNGGKDTYPSEGAFLAAAALNGTLDRRIRKLERALAVAAGLKGSLPMCRKGKGEQQQESEEEQGGVDYELSWEKADGGKGGGGSDALRKGATGRHLAGELLKHVAWGDKMGLVKAAAGAGGGQADGGAAPPAFENRLG